MSSDSQQTLTGLGAAFVEQLRVEHAKALAYAHQLGETIEAIERTMRGLSTATPPTQLALGPRDLQPSLSASIRGSSSMSGDLTVTPRVTNGGWARRLQGFTQAEALVLIAEENNGIVRTKDATNILIKAGLSTGQPRNLYRYVLNILSKSGEFERVGKGTYRLVARRTDVDSGIVQWDESEKSDTE